MYYGATSVIFETDHTGWYGIDLAYNKGQLALMDPIMREIRTKLPMSLLNGKDQGASLDTWDFSVYAPGTEFCYNLLVCNRPWKKMPVEFKNIIKKYGDNIYVRFIRLVNNIFKISGAFKKGENINVPRVYFSMNRFNHGFKQNYLEVDADMRKFINHLYNIVCVSLKGINKSSKDLLLNNAGDFKSSDGRFRKIKLLELLLFYIDTLNTMLTKMAMQFPNNRNFAEFVKGYKCSADFIDNLLEHYDNRTIKHYFLSYAKDPVNNDIFLRQLTPDEIAKLKKI